MTRFKNAEVEICSHCDCDCWGCNRFVDVCPTTPMTVSQVALFVEESLDLGWAWDRIRILGGEPTLHREFPQVLQRLLEYRQHFPNTQLIVVTNRRGNLKQHRSYLEENGIEIGGATKTRGRVPDWFGNLRSAPMDRDPTIQEFKACSIGGVNGCGVGVTKHGLFLCGAGASIARVIGADIGVMRLADMTQGVAKEQAKTLCRLCGHWTDQETSIKRVPRVPDTGRVMSQFWRETLADWEPQPMSLYGGER